MMKSIIAIAVKIRRIDEEAIHRQLDNNAIVLIGPVAVSLLRGKF